MERRPFIKLSLTALTGSCVLNKNDAEASEKQLTRDQILQSLLLGTQFMKQIAVRGGYVYWTSADLQERFGEGKATATEIWVEPPGTPSVGTAFLNAWQATGNDVHQQAAMDAAEALLFGQLESGCWSDRIDFDPKGREANRYRHGQGNQKGRNYSTLVDDKSQSALRFLMELDKQFEFKNSRIHEAVQFGLKSLLNAQFNNGGFPQGWNHALQKLREGRELPLQASYPNFDWRNEGRHKNYWDYPTLNDGLAGTVTRTLDLAYRTYEDEQYLKAIRSLGDFLIAAQMPSPQPAWAQQYNFQMQPMWARKFEPPAIVGSESQDAIEALLLIHKITNDSKYLGPIPEALKWLRHSQLPDGRIARFYELKTNRPLYFKTDSYELTYEDNDLPTHYSFKTKSKVESLERQFNKQKSGEQLIDRSRSNEDLPSLIKKSKAIIDLQDELGRWLSNSDDKPIKRSSSEKIPSDRISSRLFAENMNTLSQCLLAMD